MNSITYEEAPFEAASDAPAPPRSPSLEERALSVIERYWQAVINRRLMIGAILLLSVTIGVVVYMLATPRYEATARIEISRTQAKVINIGGVEVEDRARDIQFYETQYNLLKARSLAERVVRSLGLQNNSEFFAAFGIERGNTGGEGKAGRNPDDQAAWLDAAARLLLSGIEIDPVGNSNLVDIHFRSSDAALSARIANAWAQEYIQANLDRRFATTADARGFLEQRLNQLRTRLEQSERELVAYASGRGIVTLSSTVDAQGKSRSERTMVMDDLAALNTALNRATADRIAAEAAVRAAVVNPAAPNQATIASLRQRRAELSARYAAMLTRFEPGWPEAEAMRSEILALDQAIATESSRSRSDAESALRGARAEEEQLRQRLETLTTTYNVQRNSLIEYQILEREVDTNRQLYDSLLQRYKEIGVAGVGTNNIALIDLAEAPGGPFEPDLPRNIVVSLLIGLLIAAVLVVVAEELDQSLRDPSQVQREFGLPLLGTIPRVDEKEVAEQLQDKKTNLYESYLAVRTNLSFLTDHGAPGVFMLTSSRPDEGKSLSAFALARMFSEAGARTVLIDADMRNTHLDDLVAGADGPGLSNYLSGAATAEEIVQRPAGQGFAVVLAGPQPPNAAELLASDRLKKLIEELRRSFDHVIVDAPPVLGLADAPLISRAVDGVLFVIESNVGKLRVVRGALKRLELPGARIFGALVTKLDDRNMSYGYGYGYGYGHRYGRRQGGDAESPEARAA